MEDPNIPPAKTEPKHATTALPPMQALISLDEFMTRQGEYAGTPDAFTSYYKLLVAYVRQHMDLRDRVNAPMAAAQKMIKEYNFTAGLTKHLNTAYQAMQGPRPGDSLRNLIDGFIVDDHQWKHYKNGSDEWGLFNCKWEDVHKIILHGAKLILHERAKQLDQHVDVKSAVMDGYVEFNVPIGTPGNYVKKEVNLVKIQISRDSKVASGHGYPVPGIDKAEFPVVKSTLAKALTETLIKDNNSARVKRNR